jgi:hypothetical protein
MIIVRNLPDTLIALSGELNRCSDVVAVMEGSYGRLAHAIGVMGWTLCRSAVIRAGDQDKMTSSTKFTANTS